MASAKTQTAKKTPKPHDLAKDVKPQISDAQSAGHSQAESLEQSAPEANDTIGTLPVSELRLSSLNPRQHVSDLDIQEMADSLLTVGLIQNIGGYRADDGKVAIVFGGRRLRGLQRLQEQIGENYSARVKIAPDRETAARWALTENEQRSDPHPADEITAYANAVENCSTVFAIATATGKTERHVKGRLRLANLAPDILAALRDDKITLDTAAAFTVCDDHGRQTEMLAKVVNNHWNAYQIRRELTEDKVSAFCSLAHFLTRETYEQAGGTVDEDLFGDDVYFDDRDLFLKLVEEKRQTITEEHKALGWKWVEWHDEYPSWQVIEGFKTIQAKKPVFTEEEQANYDELASHIESGAAEQADIDALQELQDKLDKPSYTTNQMAYGGVILYLDHNGGVRERSGLVTREDQNAAVTALVLPQPSKDEIERQSGKQNGPFSGALETDLGFLRTASIQTAILQDPDLAFDALVFSLSRTFRYESNPFSIDASAMRNSVEGDEGLVLGDDLQAANDYADTLDPAAAATEFEEFRGMSKQLKLAAMTEAVARSFSASLNLNKNPNGFAELIARATKANVRDVWHPTATFLKRLKADQLDEIAAFVGGFDAGFLRLKKSEKVVLLHKAFNDEETRKQLTTRQIANLNKWVPQGFESAKAVAKRGIVKKNKAGKAPRKAA